jgi:hypothetical protein
MTIASAIVLAIRANPVGQTLRVNYLPFKVVGVLRAKATSSTVIFGYYPARRRSIQRCASFGVSMTAATGCRVSLAPTAAHIANTPSARRPCSATSTT